MEDSSSSSPTNQDLENNSLQAYNAWRQQEGLPPMAAKLVRRSHMYKISDDATKGLDLLARQQGFTYWGGGAISQLLEAIGQGYFTLVPVSK